MSATLLSGKEVSQAMLAKVLEDAEMLIAKGITPTLAIFRVGEDPGSISYEKSIIKTLKVRIISLHQRQHLKKRARSF